MCTKCYPAREERGSHESSTCRGLGITTDKLFERARTGQSFGEYVEARTAEVFAGGCIMNSEAETMGRQAIMAWKITTGSFDGVVLDGLTVAAAVAGDRNLGMREMGGEEPTAVKAIITVDPRADAGAARCAGASRARVVARVDHRSGARRYGADQVRDLAELRRGQRARSEHQLP